MNTRSQLLETQYIPSGLWQAVQSYLHQLGLKTGALIVLYFLGGLLFSLMGVPAAWMQSDSDDRNFLQLLGGTMQDFSLMGGGIALTLGIFCLGEASLWKMIRSALWILLRVLALAFVLTVIMGGLSLGQSQGWDRLITGPWGWHLMAYEIPLLSLLVAFGLVVLRLIGHSLKDGYKWLASRNRLELLLEKDSLNKITEDL